MSEFKTFVVLEGQLHENMEFKMLRSYETTTAPQQDRFAKQDTGISISAQLLDDTAVPALMRYSSNNQTIDFLNVQA
jgi:hypothetical protein